MLLRRSKLSSDNFSKTISLLTPQMNSYYSSIGYCSAPNSYPTHLAYYAFDRVVDSDDDFSTATSLTTIGNYYVDFTFYKKVKLTNVDCRIRGYNNYSYRIQIRGSLDGINFENLTDEITIIPGFTIRTYLANSLQPKKSYKILRYIPTYSTDGYVHKNGVHYVCCMELYYYGYYQL